MPRRGWCAVRGSIGGGGYLLLAFIAAKQAFKGKEGAVEAGQSEGSGGAKQEAASQVADAAGGDLLLTLSASSSSASPSPSLSSPTGRNSWTRCRARRGW